MDGRRRRRSRRGLKRGAREALLGQGSERGVKKIPLEESFKPGAVIIPELKAGGEGELSRS
jgi:hypothetical protein